MKEDAEAGHSWLEVIGKIENQSKKVVDKTVNTRYTNQADCESETKREQPLRKKQKKNTMLLFHGI